MKKVSKLLKGVVTLACAPLALAILGLAYLMMLVSVPVVKDVTDILNSINDKNKNQ